MVLLYRLAPVSALVMRRLFNQQTSNALWPYSGPLTSNLQVIGHARSFIYRPLFCDLTPPHIAVVDIHMPFHPPSVRFTERMLV